MSRRFIAGRYRPPLGCGARDGVVRAWVMDKLAAREVLLEKADVLRAESLFLTSSWLGLLPLHQVEGTVLRSNEEIVRALASEWNAQSH